MAQFFQVQSSFVLQFESKEKLLLTKITTPNELDEPNSKKNF